MSHKVCEKRYIIAAVKKALGKAMTERVRIYHLCVDAVLLCKLLQFALNAPCGDTLSTLIEKNKTAVLFLFCNAQMSDNRHQIGAQAVGMYRRNGIPYTHQRIVAAFLCVLLIGQDIKRDLAAKSAVFALYDRECRFIAFG